MTGYLLWVQKLLSWRQLRPLQKRPHCQSVWLWIQSSQRYESKITHTLSHTVSIITWSHQWAFTDCWWNSISLNSWQTLRPSELRPLPFPSYLIFQPTFTFTHSCVRFFRNAHISPKIWMFMYERRFVFRNLTVTLSIMGRNERAGERKQLFTPHSTASDSSDYFSLCFKLCLLGVPCVFQGSCSMSESRPGTFLLAASGAKNPCMAPTSSSPSHRYFFHLTFILRVL